ncbi:MAG: NADH-quinone oxidoreductase subunit N [Acidobacteriota bacterium]
MEINAVTLLPEIILSVGGVLLALLIPAVARERQARLGYPALVVVAAALVATLVRWNESGTGFAGLVVEDPFTHFARLLFLLAIGAVVATAIPYLEVQEIRRGEFFPLLLFAGVGMNLMAASADLIMLFLGLEVLAIATYALAAYRREDLRSVEAALKYFLLGAFSTAFLLLGVALVYGSTQSTRYEAIAEYIQGTGSWGPLLILGCGLLLIGFGFKAALAPLHVWTPDVYQGAPLPVMAHLAVASKAAALVALVRLVMQVVDLEASGWRELLWVSAILTMVIGNVGALTQTNLKRLLAYSSIAHAGYLLVGVVAGTAYGFQGVLFYLVAYAFMTLGALAVIQVVAGRGEGLVELEDYSGFGLRSPLLGLVLAVCLVSLAGIPLTAGFAGKFFLLAAAVEEGFYGLVIVAVLASAVGVYYYLRVLVYMYMYAPGNEDPPPVPTAVRVVLVVCTAATIFFGILPGSLLRLASEAIKL